MPRLLQTLAAAAAAGTLAATLVASPASARSTTVIRPAALPRGANVAIPHLQGHRIIDGAVQVTVDAPVVVLLGKTGSSYVVTTGDRNGDHGKILRVEPDGSATRIARAGVYSTQLSDDGARVVSWRTPGFTKTVVTAWSVATGEVVAQRVFRGFVVVLDAQDDQVLVGSDGRTRLWTTTSDTVTVVARQTGYAGDLANGLMATFTKDPYRGGCSVIREIASGKTHWRSCTERVDAFSTNGKRVATIALLSDGLGPTVVTARKLDGRAVGRYSIPKGWFGELTFESPKALLLEANGLPRGATVRCTGASCERASALHHTHEPRWG